MCEKCPSDEVYAKVAYCNKFLCLKCFNALGDFDSKGRLADRRIKRETAGVTA